MPAIEFLTEAQSKELMKLYIAYFNRAAEMDGMNYHSSKILEEMNKGTSFEQALKMRADQFFVDALAQPEFTGYTNAMTVEQFIRKVYTNVLLRPGIGGDAPTDAEVGYWVNELSGGLSRGDMVLRFLDAQDILIERGTPEEKALATKTKQIIENRVEVGMQFSQPEYSAGLTGADAFNAGTQVLVGVDETAASVTTAKQNMEGVADSQSLTLGLDVMDGGAGNSIFNGSLDVNGNVTFQSFDQLDGGAGHDKLLAQNIGNLTTTANTLQNIEVLEFVNQTAGSTIDINATSGVQHIHVNSAQGATTFNNVGSDLSIFEVTGGVAGAQTHTLSMKNDAVSGSDDSVEVRLTSVGASGAADAVVVQPTSGTNGVETINVKSVGGENFVTLDDGSSTSLNKVTVEGSSNIEIEIAAAEMKIYDGSAATGEQDIDLTANSENVTVTGGSADDDIMMGNTLGTGDKIDGGAGQDTLSINSAGTTLTNTFDVSNVEELVIADALAADLDVSNFGGGIDQVSLSGSHGADRTISGLKAQGDVEFQVAQANNTTVSLADASGSSDELNISLSATMSGAGATTRNFQTVTAANIETVTIDSTASDTPDNIGDQNVLGLTAANADNIVVKGNVGLNLGTLGTANRSIDSTMLTPISTTSGGAGGNGGLTVTLGTTAGVTATVNTGSGNDAITSVAGSDTINTGDGDDAVTLGAGDDTVNTGADDDTVTVAAVGDLDGDDTIDFGSGTDSLVMTPAETMVDGDFAGISNLEVLDLDGAANAMNFNLGSNAVAAFTDKTIEIDATGQTTGAINVNAAAFGSDAMIDVEVGSGLANDTIVGGAGADIMNGGANAAANGDILTGNGGSDKFQFESRAETRGTVAAADTGLNVDHITDFVAGVDKVALSTDATAFGAAITFTTATTVNVAGTFTNGADRANLGALMTAAEAGLTGVASTDATVQAYIIETGAEITTATGLANKRLLVINDDTAALAQTDTIIDITGVTGTITAGDFVFEAI